MREKFLLKFRSAMTVVSDAGDSRAEQRESLLPEADIQRGRVDGHYSASREKFLPIERCVSSAMEGKASIATSGREMHR